jgi:hypothetical protein
MKRDIKRPATSEPKKLPVNDCSEAGGVGGEKPALVSSRDQSGVRGRTTACNLTPVFWGN